MAFPQQFGSPTPVVITDASGNTGTSANLPVIDASVGADNAAAPVFSEKIGWLDGTGKLQAVSAANPLPVTSAGGGGGSVTQGTSPWVVSAATLPLPANAAQETGGNLAAIKADTDKIPAQGQALAAASLPVVLPAAQVTTLTPPAAITGFALETGGNLATIATRTPALGQALAAASVPVILPSATITILTPPAAITGFALEAGNLASIKTDTDKIPALGQALAAASVPVVLTAAQLTTLTPPAAISGFALESGGNLAAIKTDVDKIPMQGQALAAASMPVVLTAAQLTTLTPPAVFNGVVTQATGTNLHVVVDSAPSTAVTGSVSVSNLPATQPVSATTLPLPTGAALEAGGNLAAIAASQATTALQTRNDPQVIDLLCEILAQLRLLNMNFASCAPSAHADLDGTLLDTFPVN